MVNKAKWYGVGLIKPTSSRVRFSLFSQFFLIFMGLWRNGSADPLQG